jgi:glycosyltransferase involved in cell wall biosynthesis
LRDSPWVCGPGRTIIETGCHLDPNRFDYHVGAFVNKSHEVNPFVDGASLRKLKVLPIVETGSFDLRVIPQILRLIDINNIDILHTHEVRSDFFGLICAKLRHRPVIATAHGWIVNGLRGRLYTLADRKCLRFFDHIIAVSEKVRGTILKSGVNEEKVTTLHNALVTDHFIADPKDTSFRDELAISKDTIVVANIGRLSPEKGQADFLKAAKKVIHHFQDVKFVLIGTGPDREKRKILISASGLVLMVSAKIW